MPSQRSPSRFGAASLSVDAGSTFAFNTSFFPAFSDQLNFFGRNSATTFGQRYLINAESWGGPTFPIFFYCGNEGDISLFTNNSGFLWALAAEMKALVVFAEHRFYGASLPFGTPPTAPSISAPSPSSTRCWTTYSL